MLYDWKQVPIGIFDIYFVIFVLLIYKTNLFICFQVFVGSPEPNPNSLWKIQFDKELTTCDTSITLQHIKSDKCLGVYIYQENCPEYYYNGYYKYTKNCYHKSPLTNHTEGNSV